MTNLLKHKLVKLSALVIVSLMLSLTLSVTSVLAIRDANPRLITKGGVIYPNTGDSTQVRYRMPKEARKILRPGDLLGVLPSNCNSASGPEGDYYICAHGIYLQPYFYGDRLTYAVLKIE
jgi:hypothetical protein